MKAKVKATGEIVDVYERYDDYAGETRFEPIIPYYRPDELDLTVEGPEEVTIEGWVARDEDGFINLFNGKPMRDYADRSDVTYGFWDRTDGHLLELPTTSFPSVTWESEPQKVKITTTPIQ